MDGIGLALSGGGIKGAAHIGVLKALEESDIKVDYMAGTSSGSIVASLYASGYTPDEIYDLFKEYCYIITSCNLNSIWKAIKSVITKGKLPIGFIDGRKIENIVNKACSLKRVHNINDIKMPLAVESVNIDDGTLVVFLSNTPRGYIDDKVTYISNINIGKAVRASSSFPAVFNTCNFLDYNLVDGGTRDNIPIEILYAMGAKKTIASFFDSNVENSRTDNLFEIIMRSVEIMGFEMRAQKIKKADYTIATKIDNVKLLDMSKLDLCYKSGYETAKKKIKEIKL